MIVLQIILATILAYLTLSGLYQAVLALASGIRLKAQDVQKEKYNRFLVLVPAYKCDEVILQSVKKNMGMKYLYPKTHFDITVIADQIESSTKEKLEELGARVHSVSFEKSTKAKSLQSAITANEEQYDAVVVLDADNIAGINFLNKANHALNSGQKIIQGNRKAANKNSAFALLDGLSEAANTKMLCQGANALGLSSKLSGSAMVFEYELFAEAIMKMEAIGGFDKELELYFTRQGDYIHYANELVVLDEKISDSGAFAKQRGRWLQAQYNFFKVSLVPACQELFKGNKDYFHKTMQLALPPRALSPFVLVAASAIAFLAGLQALALIGLLGFMLTIGSYLLVLNIDDLFTNAIKIASALPALSISVIKSLAIMKRAKTEFIHTEHKVAIS